MEQCKRDGDIMNTRDVVNEDRISELPEALILQILSLLPTEIVVATSVLSKQWQSLWKMLPELKFDSYHHRHELRVFSSNVSRSLLSHKSLALQSLHLIICLDRCNSMDTEILVGIALNRNVRKLVLEVSQGQLLCPKSLYTCEKVETLELKYSISMDVPSSVCLLSLRTLHLLYVTFNNDESILNLLSGCPNLENLFVGRYGFDNVKTFNIAVPSLQRLTTYTLSSVDPYEGYVINAPCLKYLKIFGINQIQFFLIEKVPELVEASLIVDSHIINENLLGSLTSVKRLSLELSPLKIKFPTGSIFYQLVYLELITREAEGLKLLTLLLDTSPNLQVLKLINHPNWKDDVVGKWNQPKNVPECFLFHLETFMWKEYKWRQEAVIEVVKYILGHTNCLKRAIFSSKHVNSYERIEMVKYLNSMVRASSSCQLQFK